MAKFTHGSGGQGMKSAKRGDASTLVRTDNPDDAEFAPPLAPGDEDSLVAIDNPDDGDDYKVRSRTGGKEGAAAKSGTQPRQ